MKRIIKNKTVLILCKRQIPTLLGLFFALQGPLVFADNTNFSSTKSVPMLIAETTANQGQSADPSQDKAYKEEMLKLSNAIVQKVSEIQAKQKALDNEIYPAYKPALQADLDNLKKDLDNLKLRKTQLEEQKNATDTTKKLNNSGNNSIQN